MFWLPTVWQPIMIHSLPTDPYLWPNSKQDTERKVALFIKRWTIDYRFLQEIDLGTQRIYCKTASVKTANTRSDCTPST